MWLSLLTVSLAIAICLGVAATMNANQIRGESFPG
jgi:hypothetical protein